MTEIPENLLRRSQAARARNPNVFSGSEAMASQYAGDPFAAKKHNAEASAEKLLAAKAKLLTTVLPLRHALAHIDVDLRGQFLNAKSVKSGIGFTASQASKPEVFLTLYGNREEYFEVDGGKSVRVGEQHAWRMPVSKNEVGALLKKTGRKPFRDTFKLVKDEGIIVEASDIPTDIAERVFDTATSERVTNSAALYKGKPNTSDYNDSYGNRYFVGVSILRESTDTPETNGLFGVDLQSLTSADSVDEGYKEGGIYDKERIVMFKLGSLFEPRPAQVAFTNAFTEAAVALSAFSTLLTSPADQSSVGVYQAIDAHFRR